MQPTSEDSQKSERSRKQSRPVLIGAENEPWFEDIEAVSSIWDAWFALLDQEDETNIAIENGELVGGLPMKYDDFP